ncbi:uncharacterized protein EV420DRAFT_1655981 [Desarmillaria tabescens]|uniref:Uncharacterized protein n=1 Tax=Armillaria tabescens TaxID=1929756 RepID=A0AA39IYK8_ARMTA|nr:uncharacterized protein EV420DRAFT_1655981 [Desarmillaria tabescens]KAK0432101.1 hypothetical protein EV420DRAFT_1655981 [Desarmillaria tabescens]
MTSHMSTRGVASTVPSELISCTRTELADTRRQRTEAKEHKKEVNEEKKRQQKEQQQQAQRKIAALEDVSAREDKAIYSLRPDLDLMKKGLPAPSRQHVTVKSSNKKAITAVNGPDDAESMDDLPLVSVVAMSESDGPADNGMDVDSASKSEQLPTVEDSSVPVLVEEDDSDDAYVEGQSGSDEPSEDEEALFQKFLLQHCKTKKAGSKLKA